MKKASFDGIELEYSVEGSGEAVVLIHGGLYNEASLLQKEKALTKRYRLISYNRRGYSGSTRPKERLLIPEHASDCRKLMDFLEVEKAHIVGHSIGGQIALQFAADYPSVVHTLSLLEPFLSSHAPSGQQFSQSMMPVFEMYQRGDKTGAINAMLTGMGGPDAIKMIEKVIPGGMKQLIADADTFFQVEFPAGQSWTFTAEDARRIRQPVLSIRAAESGPLFKEIEEVVRQWFPQSVALVVPHATHTMLLTNSRGVAEALAGFFARHPMKISSLVK